MNAADILMYSQKPITDALNGVPESEWDANGVCGVWSTKDVLLHLVSYEHMLEELLGTFLAGGATPTLTQFSTLPGEQFNAIHVDARRDLSGREVMDEFSATHARVLAQAARIPAETWREPGTLPWYGSQYALDDFIVYTFYGHKREHAAQINVFKDTLNARGS